MTESYAKASEGDLVEEALAAEDAGDEAGLETDAAGLPADFTVGDAEADTADLLDQQKPVPSADDDYDR
jgi:hypothetical protein